jgi:sortase (surface protein transpeptidase)
MTSSPSPADSRHSLKRWWAAAIVLLLIGAGFLTVSMKGRDGPLAGTATATPQLASPSSAALTPTTKPSAKLSAKPAAKPSAARPAPRPATQPGAVARSSPVSLRIPAIGVALRLSTLGLNPNGTVQVPTKDQQPGWYRLGPAPGQMGSAVILGHVDDYQGPAAFYRLKALHPGDKVEVTLASGAVAHFAVTRVATFLKTQFPSQQVYGSHGFPALQLVTCGGNFNSSTGHYLSNVVAFTSLVSTTPAGG